MAETLSPFEILDERLTGASKAAPDSNTSTTAAAGRKGPPTSPPAVMWCGATSPTTACCAGTRRPARVGAFRQPAGYSQRQYGGPRGPPGHLRARQPAGHPHGARRRDHGDRGPVRGQAPQQPQRRGSASPTDRSGSPTRPTASTATMKDTRRRARSAPATSIVSTRAPARCGIVADDFVRPNGLAFSPDERRLYIADTGAQPRARRAAPYPRLRRGRGRHAVGRRRVRHLHRRAPSTASGWTTRGGSGRARAMGSIAMTRTARSSARSWCPSPWRTSCSAGRNGTASLSAPRPRSTPCSSP